MERKLISLAYSLLTTHYVMAHIFPRIKNLYIGNFETLRIDTINKNEEDL